MTTHAPGPVATRLTTVAAVVTAGAGAVVLVIGWWMGVDAVTRVMPGLVSMKANTAAGFVLAGIALHPTVRRLHRPVADGAAVLLGLLGLVTLAEYATGIDLAVDQALVRDPGDGMTAWPGRMGLNTALGFVLLGIAVVAGDRRASTPTRIVAQVAAASAGLLALLALLGYLLGVVSTRGLASATEMALHTSVLFVVAALGAIAATVDVGLLSVTTSRQDAGRAARVLLPVSVLGVLAAVLAVDVASSAAGLADVSLQLAVTATASVLVVALVVLVVQRQRSRTEELAVQSADELASIRRAFPDVHLRLGPTDEVEAVAGAVRRLGLGDLRVGDRLDRVLPPSTVTPLAAAAARVRTDRRPADLTLRLGELVAEARVVPLATRGAVAVALRDVSDLAATRIELQRLTDDLERQVAERTHDLRRANDDLERFAYLASHDLQEPLRMVTGFVGKIRERHGEDLDDRGRQYLAFAEDGAQRMSALIDGLLAYSRAGRIDPSRVATVPLRGVVHDAVAALGATLAAEQAVLETEVDDAMVTVEPSLLGQVVQNLLGNAVKFHRPDDVPHVRLIAARDHDTVTIAVEDDGIGIAPEHRQEVFAMFRRVSTDPRHRGTGIGLSLVQQIVEAHGGRIHVSDGAGDRGTRFTVELPAGRASVRPAIGHNDHIGAASDDDHAPEPRGTPVELS